MDVELERKKAPKGQGKEKCKEQWNSINKQITNIMNYKGNMDSQLLLDELIKQSDHNQNWIDNELSNEKECKDWPLEPESEGLLS